MSGFPYSFLYSSSLLVMMTRLVSLLNLWILSQKGCFFLASLDNYPLFSKINFRLCYVRQSRRSEIPVRSRTSHPHFFLSSSICRIPMRLLLPFSITASSGLIHKTAWQYVIESAAAVLPSAVSGSSVSACIALERRRYAYSSNPPAI